MEELPLSPQQHLMSRGYGYGAEGRLEDRRYDSYYQAMTQGLKGGSSFMGLHLPLRKGQ